MRALCAVLVLPIATLGCSAAGYRTAGATMGVAGLVGAIHGPFSNDPDGIEVDASGSAVLAFYGVCALLFVAGGLVAIEGSRVKQAAHAEPDSCKGTSTPCERIHLDFCDFQDGCRVDDSSRSCVGSPTSCPEISTGAACAEQDGCRWDAS